LKKLCVSSLFLQSLFVYNKNLVFIINKNLLIKTLYGCCFYKTNIKFFEKKRKNACVGGYFGMTHPGDLQE